ncbi:MAG: hypothetical protein FJY79_05340 [Candidatus Aminicenantes bacterium]|nr:hypothetical protein [Candidatus Aminicenantes bacterium]
MKEKKLCRLGCLSVLLVVLAMSLEPQASARSAAQADSSPAAYAAATAPRDAILPAPRTDAAYGKIPLQFIPNEGQMDGAVAFSIQGRDKTVHFTSEGLTFVLDGSHEPAPPSAHPQTSASLVAHPPTAPARAPSRGWVVKLDFIDANPDAVPVSLEESGAVISYFKGAPADWKTGLRASSKIAYRELWPGIDLIYHGTVDRLKYEFIVHPGADPSRIRLAYRGADSVTLTAEGRLEVSTPAAAFSDDIPVAWQDIGVRSTEIPVGYVMHGADYGFEVGEYDRSRPLIIDPAVLIYCGYIGGAGTDVATAIAVDDEGNAFVTGFTFSTEATFPVEAGPVSTHGGAADAFVAKVDASGASLVYCGYIGGADDDFGQGIAVDKDGNAYVAGFAGSAGDTFPVVAGPDLVFNLGGDAFVAKVDASGTSLVYCGYIGGEASESAMAIAVDASGNAYVTGYTYSTEVSFPVLIGPDLSFNAGLVDAFVAKVDASGVSLAYCGYIGGASYDAGLAIAVDSEGNAYVTGFTQSPEATFPVAVGPGLTYGGEGDAFAAKVDALGVSLAYCGYIGGSGYDHGYGIAVDGAGSAYVAGFAGSTAATFPVAVGPSLIHSGWEDAFVAKVDASGASLVYCGYIGGGWHERATAIAVDSEGCAYVTGYTESSQSSFPVVAGPGLTFGGWRDAFVAKVDASGASLVFCGYIGGTGDDYGTGISVDSEGNAYVAGETGRFTGDEIPLVIGPFLTYGGGFSDAFVAKVSYAPDPAIVSLLPSSAKAGDPAFVLSATGSGFIDGAVVMWDGQARSTTFVNSFELNAQIGAGDLATGKIVQVTVANPPPVGGSSEAVAFPVTTFTMGSTPASATVGAGQSASYTIQVTPQFGSFDSAIAFSCTGLPGATTASFSPASVTPGAGSATTTLTVTTRARQSAAFGAAGAIGVGSAGIGSAGAAPPALLGPPLILGSLLALLLLVLLLTAILPRLLPGKPVPAKLTRRRRAACAVICLVVLLAACGASDGPSPSTGTPAGTYQITVRGVSGGLTLSTTVTLVVN